MKIFAIAAAFLLVTEAAHAQSVSVRNLVPPGTFEVVNEGGNVSLSSKVQVQHLYKGAWYNVGWNVRLVRSCDIPQIPDCITLHRGERLQPLPWNGYSCSSQCSESCRANTIYPPGTFRFVVTSCSGDKSFAGPAFYMSETLDEPLWKPPKTD